MFQVQSASSARFGTDEGEVSWDWKKYRWHHPKKEVYKLIHVPWNCSMLGISKDPWIAYDSSNYLVTQCFHRLSCDADSTPENPAAKASDQWLARLWKYQLQTLMSWRKSINSRRNFLAGIYGKLLRYKRMQCVSLWRAILVCYRKKTREIANKRLFDWRWSRCFDMLWPQLHVPQVVGEEDVCLLDTVTRAALLHTIRVLCSDGSMSTATASWSTPGWF